MADARAGAARWVSHLVRIGPGSGDTPAGVGHTLRPGLVHLRDPVSRREPAGSPLLFALAWTGRAGGHRGLRHREGRAAKSRYGRFNLAFSLLNLIPLALAIVIINARLQSSVPSLAVQLLA